MQTQVFVPLLFLAASLSLANPALAASPQPPGALEADAASAGVDEAPPSRHSARIPNRSTKPDLRKALVWYSDGTVEVQTYELLEDGRAVFQGDMVLPLDKDGNVRFFLERPKSTGYLGLLWPKATVAYDIDPALTIASAVEAAIRDFEAATGMHFVRRTTEPDYVWFTPGQGCSSWIGRQGGRQDIILEPACGKPAAMHEIGHAVGLFHEQSRTDRDSYVIINYNNIDPARAYNFNIFDPSQGYNSGPYDYTSIMHYDSYAFSINGQPTITKTNGSLIPYNFVLSTGDIAGVQSMYRIVNLLQNGSFETGARSPWKKWPSTAPGVAAVESCCGNQTPGGTWDAYIRPEGQYVELYQKVAVTPGRTYRLTTTVSTKNLTANIEWFSDVSGDHVCASTSVRWMSVVRLTCDITVPVGTTDFNVGLSGNGPTGSNVWTLSDDWFLIDLTNLP